MAESTRPDNIFCRYYAWRAQHLPPAVRAQAEAIDAFLHSRRAIGLWLAVAAGFAGATAGITAGLVGAGFEFRMSLWIAIALAGLMLFVLLFGVTNAWLRPERFSARRMWRIAFLMAVASYAGALASVIGVHSSGLRIEGGSWLAKLLDVFWRATTLQLGIGLGILLVLWAVGAARRSQLQREMAQLRLVQERDAAARDAAEARLHLLQRQIQPHFLFNTLAALQHWVDSGDARAPALLQALTALLRETTETLARSTVTLAEEAGMARHYLEIMQARLGARLRFEIRIPAEALAQSLPPGVLMTLVENAIQHGIEPSLRGGSVQIDASCSGGVFELHVEDDGAGLRAAWHDGIGLANCRERLRHRFGAAASLALGPGRDGGTRASLRIATVSLE